MTIQDITEALTLEVEVPTTGLRNLLANPSGGLLGAWGWRTPLSGTLTGKELQVLPYTEYLEYAAAAGSYIGPESEDLPVTPGEYVAASWTTRAHSSAGLYLAAAVRFYDAAGTYIYVSPMTAFSNAVGRHALPPYQVPAGAATARLMFFPSSTTPSWTAPPAGSLFRFHDVTVATAATAAELGPVSTNLFSNPSFETNTTGWLITGGVLSRTQEVAATAGAWRGKIVPSGTGPVTLRTQTEISVFNGYTYRFQVDRGTTGPAWSLQVEWRTFDNKVVSTTTIPQDPASASGVADVVAPPTGLRAWPRVVSYGTAWPDALMFTRIDDVGTPPAYFDGDTPDTSDVTYAWTGTAHATTSTRSASQLPFIPPIIWRDILGSTASINVQRRAFDATLQATIRDTALDPAQEQLLRPGRRVKVTLPTMGDTRGGAPMFYGRIRKPEVTYDYKRAKPGKEATITLTGYGVGADLAALTRPDGVAEVAHLPHVLEGVPVPYDVDGNTGQVAPPAIVSHNPQAKALDQVLLARDTDLAYAWVNRSGVLMVRSDRAADYYPPNQALDLDESVYTGLSVAFDPEDCINSVTVVKLQTNAAGEAEEVTFGPYEDATSVREWGRQAREFRIHGPQDPATYAAAILAANATPTIRVSDLRLRIRDTADLSPYALADIYALAHITNARSGLDATLRVQGVEHAINATPRGVTWDVGLSFTGGEDQVAAPVNTTPLPSAKPPPSSMSGHLAASRAGTSGTAWQTMYGWSGATANIGSYSGGVWTIPEEAAGVYEIEFAVHFSTHATNVRAVSIHVNGASVARGQASGAAGGGVTAYVSHKRVVLAAGDQLSFEWFQNSGASLTLTAGASLTYYNVRRVSL